MTINYNHNNTQQITNNVHNFYELLYIYTFAGIIT